MQEGVCLDGCMLVLMGDRVEDEQGSGPTANGKGGEMGRHTEENDEKVVLGHVEPKVQLIRAPCGQLRVYYTCTTSGNKGR